MIKRFVIFSGGQFGMAGGWRDFKMFGDGPEALLLEFLDSGRGGEDDWYQVVDLAEGDVVKEGSLRELRQERCGHAHTYMVEPPIDTGILVSGQYSIPGKYCSDCGKLLEVWSQ